MNEAFPIEKQARLPIRIDPCPIVEAIFEARFVSKESWSTMPGLLFAQIRDKYPDSKQMPIAQVPEEIRRQDPALQTLPLMQFLAKDFLIQLGPKVVSLVTKPNAYPGWSAIQTELEWLISKLAAAGFVGETDRLSARYIDFFNVDIFDVLRLGLQINGDPYKAGQTDLATVFRRGELAIRLQMTNGAIVQTKEGPKSGSVLDVDGWFGPSSTDLFENGIARFDEVHQSIKELFFGLMKPDVLATFNPVYE